MEATLSRQATSLPLWTTDENQGWAAMVLSEFAAIPDDGSVAEVSPRALVRMDAEAGWPSAFASVAG